VLPLSIYGIIPANAPLALAVLVVTAIFAFEPGRARERDWEYEPDDIDITAALSNGGNPNTQPVEERVDGGETPEYDDERLPWL
jgi:hypothetical protein